MTSIRSLTVALGVAVVAIATSSATYARVTKIVIDETIPLPVAAGVAAPAIAYEQIAGRAFGELDPKLSGNALARYEYAVGNGYASVQGDVQYSGQFCFTVLCAPVERESAYALGNVRLGYEPASKTWEVAAFIDNVTNKAYRVYAFDSSLFAGVVAGVYGKPRTWGITGTVRFGASHH